MQFRVWSLDAEYVDVLGKSDPILIQISLEFSIEDPTGKSDLSGNVTVPLLPGELVTFRGIVEACEARGRALVREAGI